MNKQKSRLKIWAFTISLLFALMLIILVVVPARFPAFGADMADFLRSIVGPKPVAVLETLSFKLHDEVNSYLYQDGQAHIQFEEQNTPIATAATTATPPADSAIQTTPLPPQTNVISAVPQIGWQAYGAQVNGESVLARTLIVPDPERPYSAVALVRIDISKVQLHLHPGQIEPERPSDIKLLKPAGLIPIADQEKTIAAFNGGFKAIHGHFGVMIDHQTLIKPTRGLGTIAIYDNGRIEVGEWGKDIIESADIAALRQNCPPLIINGAANPAVFIDDRDTWGFILNSDITWRTALGITQDQKYLIYAVGNDLTAPTLVNTLLDAGAYSAMQMDVGKYFAHFYTYTPNTDPVTSKTYKLTEESLLAQMTNNPHLYLKQAPRDFFYLTMP